MKRHHLIGLIIATILIGAFFLWPRPSIEQGDELTGVWYGGGTNADGFEWWMKYTFEADGSFALDTSHGYTEEGRYAITKRYLDGSMNIHKIWKNGTKEYDFVIVTTDDPDLIYLEGVELKRQ